MPSMQPPKIHKPTPVPTAHSPKPATESPKSLDTRLVTHEGERLASRDRPETRHGMTHAPTALLLADSAKPMAWETSHEPFHNLPLTAQSPAASTTYVPELKHTHNNNNNNNNNNNHNWFNMNTSINGMAMSNHNGNPNANPSAVLDINDRPDADSDAHTIGYVGMSDAGMLLQQPAKSTSASVSDPMPPFTVYSSTSASRFVVHNQHMRECMAEFLGTLVMILFGMAVNNQVVLSKDKNGTWLSVNMCWGVAVMLGVHCSDGISGAHLNPAVTIAMATYHRLPWRKVPGYLLAQLLGAFVGAAAIYALYYQVIDVVDPDYTFTRANFATYPSADISNVTAFYTEFLATAMLLVGVFSITDKRNRPASPFGTPVHFMLLIWAIGMAFGMNTGYAINPARDFGPRLFTSLAGWGSQVFTLRNHYFWIPLIAPPLGGVCGAGLYKLLVELHHPPQKSDDLEYQSRLPF